MRKSCVVIFQRCPEIEKNRDLQASAGRSWQESPTEVRKLVRELSSRQADRLTQTDRHTNFRKLAVLGQFARAVHLLEIASSMQGQSWDSEEPERARSSEPASARPAIQSFSWPAF